jgi:sulfur relay (sulfurtransferase) DsrC/TusE family protein
MDGDGYLVDPDAWTEDWARAPAHAMNFELFPYGYPGQACKIAGMRRPRVWSTG